jgi:hypothetical protein
VSPLPGNGDGPEFQFTSLASDDRVDIVTVSADQTVQGSAAIPAAQFELTALGANVDLDGYWDAPITSLAEWHHIASLGRDSYVKVVRRGYLFPFGHRAVIIEITDRELRSDPASPGSFSDAVLIHRQYVKVLQPTKTYPASGQPFGGRDWPFTSVEMKTRITPPLDQTPVNIGMTNQVMELTVLGQPFEWAVVLTDTDGNIVHSQVPLGFCWAEDSAHTANPFDGADGDAVAEAVVAYNGLSTYPRTMGLGGRRVKFAPLAGTTAGSTTHPTLSLTLGAATSVSDPQAVTADQPPQVIEVATPPTKETLQGENQPAFYPTVQSAQLRLAAAEALARRPVTDSAGSGVSFSYFGPYVVGPGFTDDSAPPGSNPGAVYAQATDYSAQTPGSGPGLTFPGDAVGAVATPNICISGLSARAGPVSGPLATYAQEGRANPQDYFNVAGAASLPQFLGGIQLADVLGEFSASLPGAPVLSQTDDPTTGTRQVVYELRASLVSWPSDNAVFLPRGSQSLSLTTTVTQEQSKPPTTVVQGSFSPFDIYIASTNGDRDFIKLPIERATFTSRSGSKPDFKVEIGQVEFQGSLAFLNALQRFLEGLGGSGFTVTAGAKQITAGTSVGLPSIDVGVLSLEHLGMTASLVLPYTSQPAKATFGFASQEHPFLVSVAMFGGGGYVQLSMGLTTVEAVTVSIDFSGNFSLDVGVASGGISLVAGITYVWTNASGSTMTGFVRLSGSIYALGVIGIGVELDLSLSYHSDGTTSYVEGAAELVASIHLIFFSIDIDVSVHKQFAGSSVASTPSGAALSSARSHRLPSHTDVADDTPVVPPVFKDLFSSDDWSSYCRKFAG